MARKKYRSQLDSIDKINMTPMIDLMLLLLIIFMMAAPLLEYSLEVNTPEMNASEMPDNNVASVELDKDGRIVFNNIKIQAIEELLRELSMLKEHSPKTVVLVRADGSRPYEDVIKLMRTIKASGFTNISLVTQAENDRDK